MEITEAFVKAVEMGAVDIRSTVEGCEKELAEKYPDGSSPYILRLLEEKRQTSDLLLGWAARARKELNLPA